MSLDAKQSEARAVTTVDDLVGYFRAAEKKAGDRLIGLEHEKLIYPKGGAVPPAYTSGIERVLAGFAAHGWKEHREAEGLPVIAMTRGNATLSLEPGGQFELSGSAVKTARAAQDENLKHAAELKAVLQPLGLRAVTLGYRPFERIADMPWMPKTRYRVMRETLGARGTLAHDMMLMTATGQVSLDWADEAECAEMMSLSARVSPLLVALYANSPLKVGRETGFLSYRSHVWGDVDPARCGYLPSMFDGSFSYRAYVEWALDAPLLFLRRRGEYLGPRMTFRQLLADGFEGKPALYDDWVDHLSTLFPEVRIKRVMEIRSADCCSVAMTGALVALLRGLLYDRGARDELSKLV
ncbi:MAG: glutamate--cysteine ligase, partial [Myxococcaceae bacterium]|nr:glutamate--cysteine ligase [Myxococcaceae bacterium]